MYFIIVIKHIIEIAKEWKILYSILKLKFGFFRIWPPLTLIPKVWNRVIIVNEIAFFACCIFCRFRDNYKTLQFNSQTAFSIFYNCIFLSFFTNNLADLWDLKRHQNQILLNRFPVTFRKSSRNISFHCMLPSVNT